MAFPHSCKCTFIPSQPSAAKLFYVTPAQGQGNDWGFPQIETNSPSTAGIYFLLGYTFLGSVQIMVYAGGIVVLYVFSILLTSGEGDRAEKLKRSRLLAGLFTMIAGLGIILFITLKHNFLQTGNLAPQEINIHAIGNALLSSDKYGYILPFEAISILLLACIIGGIIIARKR